MKKEACQKLSVFFFACLILFNQCSHPNDPAAPVNKERLQLVIISGNGQQGVGGRGLANVTAQPYMPDPAKETIHALGAEGCWNILGRVGNVWTEWPAVYGISAGSASLAIDFNLNRLHDFFIR